MSDPRPNALFILDAEFLPLIYGLEERGELERLALAFNRIADPALTYIVEAKNDLTAAMWDFVWSGTGTVSVPDTVPVTDTELIANHPKRFLRLRVTC